jgi:hypothetical protein
VKQNDQYVVEPIVVLFLLALGHQYQVILETLDLGQSFDRPTVEV